VLRKDYSALTAKMKNIWCENAIDFNNVDLAERQVMDGTPVLTLDVTDVTKWAICSLQMHERRASVQK